MKIHKRALHLLCIFSLVLSLATPCFAAETVSSFIDVPADHAYLEGIEYSREHGIIVGVGGGKFLPDDPVTVFTMSVILCRAYGVDVGERGFVNAAYDMGWVNETAIIGGTDTKVCRGAFYDTLFKAEGIVVYDKALYAEDGKTAAADDWHCALNAAVEFGLCGEDAAVSDIMTRGEAVYAVMQVLTHEYQMVPPAILSEFNLVVGEGYNPNPYMLAVQKVPSAILEDFQARQWTLCIDDEYIQEFNKTSSITAVGLTSYQNKTIYCISSGSIVHEFGHFFAWYLPKTYSGQLVVLFSSEGENGRDVLGDYAMTNVNEYFAEYFEYWIYNHDDELLMAALKAATPQTCALFESFEQADWDF